jgi:glycosyltransferase involved in cell wall biosynthesis
MKVFFVTRYCYLDDSNGAAVSSREILEALSRQGFAIEVLSSTALDLDIDVNPAVYFAERGWQIDEVSGQSLSLGALGMDAGTPPHLRLTAHGVPVTLLQSATTRSHEPDDHECRGFLRLFDAIMERFRPDVVLGYGGDSLQGQVFARARRLGAATVFNLHNCRYRSIQPFIDVDAITVPSRFAAEFYRRSLGLECQVRPNPIRRDRIQTSDHVPKYLTFITPSVEKGVFVFARIADELGRRRPDIPLLVVEGRGTEVDVAACGLDLRTHGNVFFMSHVSDPRRFYRVSRAVMMPSLIPETFGRVAAEAMCNGIPVLASDRGALPETLGASGIVLPLPERLTPTCEVLPEAQEVMPWVEAIIRLWDDVDFYEELCHRALCESGRWDSATVESWFASFFLGLTGIASTARDVRFRCV